MLDCWFEVVCVHVAWYMAPVEIESQCIQRTLAIRYGVLVVDALRYTRRVQMSNNNSSRGLSTDNTSFPVGRTIHGNLICWSTT